MAVHGGGEGLVRQPCSYKAIRHLRMDNAKVHGRVMGDRTMRFDRVRSGRRKRVESGIVKLLIG